MSNTVDQRIDRFRALWPEMRDLLWNRFSCGYPDRRKSLPTAETAWREIRDHYAAVAQDELESALGAEQLDERAKTMTAVRGSVWGKVGGAGYFRAWPGHMRIWCPLLEYLVEHTSVASSRVAELLDALIDIDARTEILHNKYAGHFSDELPKPNLINPVQAIETRLGQLAELAFILDRATQAITIGDGLYGEITIE